MGISVLYVVRNEEKLLPKSIDSIKELADQIVVVDTGSADGTVRAARASSRKVKVTSYPWTHDYSKARNHGLDHCSEDWVFYLDADEVVDHKTVNVIRKAILSSKPNVWGFSLKVMDFPEGFGADPKEPFFRSPQVRIFRNHPDVRFRGIVAESVEASIAERHGGIDLLPGVIQHWIWRGKGKQFAALRVKYYRKLGALIPDPDVGPQPAEDASMLAPPPPKPALAIIVVGFDCSSHTRQCVGAMRRVLSVPYRLILVDNGSSDDTWSFMTQEEPDNAIQLRTNQGVAKARNAALQRVSLDPSVKMICFMDNDCIPSRGAMEEMIRVLESDEGIAAVGPISNTAPGAQSYGRVEKPFMEEVPQEVLTREPDHVEVTQLARFCMLFRSDALRRVGHFDESLGGMEAEDMSARVKGAGLRMAVANRAYVFHRGRTTMLAHPNLDWYSMGQTAAIRFRTKWNIEREENKARRVEREKARANLPPYMIKARENVRKAPTYAPRSEIVPTISTKPRPRVDIVILTHNRLDMTKPCVESIMRHTINYRLIFVDNASTDGTVEYLQGVPNSVLIRNDRNVGIPMGRNQGIRASTAPYVILMDNDIEIKGDWVGELFSDIRNGASMVGIEGWRLDRNWGSCAKCTSANQTFDYLGGACVLYDRRVFEVAGLLDEGYSPAYYEDVEMSIRAKENGFRLAFNPTNAVLHKQHATLVHGQKTFGYQSALSASYDRFARRMRGELEVKYEKLPPAKKKLRILYLGMRWDYGIRERGLSYEESNFKPSLEQWERTQELRHFDFVEMGKVHGIPKMSDMLIQEAEAFQPDAVFCVFFDDHHDPRKEALTSLKRVCPAVTMNWFCDSHFRYESFDSKWAPYLDFCITTASSAQKKFARDGFGGKVIKSQWFASPNYRRIEGVEKDVPVSFIGQPHGDRRAVIDRLRAAGIKVEVYGTGWGRRLSFEEMIMMFNRTKVNLNLNNAADARFKQIKGRNFEVPACGGFLLTGAPENLPEYYEPGMEVAVFGDVTDMIEKVRYYLKNEAERERVALAGYERTMKEHTSEHRLNAIFSEAALL